MAVYIDQELCKSCKICINTCPKNVFEITHKVNKKGYNYVCDLKHKVNKKGYNYVEAVRAEDCIACHKCEISCPDFVIDIED